MADKFSGFLPPTENYSKLPHQMIDALPLVETVSELKVILYVLRHTWGFQEFDKLKRITLDEFQHGRKKGDGSRLDAGTGLSANAIKDGIARAIKHGFLIQVSDGRDFGRSSHVYQLRVSNSDTVSKSDNQASDSDSQPSKVDNQPSGSDTRSEKDTPERNSQKEKKKEESDSDFPDSPAPPAPGGADSGKEIDDDDIGNNRHSGITDRSSPANDPDRHPVEGRQLGIDDDFDVGTEKIWEFGRRTVTARAEAGGNWAIPPPAGGADAFRGGAVDAFCEVLAGIPPLKLPPELRKSWGDKLREIAKKCDAAPEIMERAIRAIPEDQIGWKTFSSPYADNFEDNIIPLLLRDGKPRQKGANHGAHQRDRGRIAQGAVRREVATEEEARAILG